MNKNLLLVALVLVLALTLSACGSDPLDSAASTSMNEISTEQVDSLNEISAEPTPLSAPIEGEVNIQVTWKTSYVGTTTMRISGDILNAEATVILVPFNNTPRSLYKGESLEAKFFYIPNAEDVLEYKNPDDSWVTCFYADSRSSAESGWAKFSCP